MVVQETHFRFGKTELGLPSVKLSGARRLSVLRMESLVVFVFFGNGLEWALCRSVTVVSAGVTFVVMATVIVAWRWA